MSSGHVKLTSLRPARVGRLTGPFLRRFRADHSQGSPTSVKAGSFPDRRKTGEWWIAVPGDILRFSTWEDAT